MRKSVLLPLAITLTPLPATASDAPRVQAVTVRVPYGDLDIATARDAAILKRRIARAVERACRAPSWMWSGPGRTDENCRSGALQAALAVMERRRAVQVAAAD